MVGDLNPFFYHVLQLKSVKRTGWVSKVNIKDAESVADHSFSMCADAMLLSDLTGLDTLRVMKMVILHDLAESIVGDYMPGDVSLDKKQAQEKKAMKSILSCIPKKIRLQYEEIWLEYLENKSDIARFVHRIDKLEMAIQANHYAKQGHDVKLLQPFLESAKIVVGDERDAVSKVLKTLNSATAKK